MSQKNTNTQEQKEDSVELTSDDFVTVSSQETMTSKMIETYRTYEAVNIIAIGCFCLGVSCTGIFGLTVLFLSTVL